jgi:hypothetical protein
VQKFLLFHAVQTSSRVHPASYQMGTRGFFRGVKQLGRDADHSPPTSAEVKKTWIYASPPPQICLHGVVLNLLSTRTTFIGVVPYRVSANHRLASADRMPKCRVFLDATDICRTVFKLKGLWKWSVKISAVSAIFRFHQSHVNPLLR